MAISVIIGACHSDYGDAPNDGDFSAHCFPNNTCNVGLVCTQGVCLHDDSSDGGDTSDPTTKGDASFVKEGSVPSDAPSDALDDTLDGPSRADAAVSDAAACTNLIGTVQNGGVCTQANQCCSSMCREDRVCVTSCRSLGDTCSSLTSSNTCCVGAHCSALICVACITSGQTPSGGNGADPTSCCSRAILNGKCQ